MSKWMSIGFDPEHMDPITEPNSTGDLDQASPEAGAVRGMNGSGGHWIAGAIKRLVTRHRTPDVPEQRL